jgi:anti-sigma regulatory factor (Ser/Thr protein kinase)
VSADLDVILHGEDELPRLAAAVDGFAQANALRPRVVTALNLVLEELVVNVFQPAAGPGGTRVRIRGTCDDDAVHGEVRDDGAPLDPLSQPPPEVGLSREDRELGGLGIHMVRSVARDLAYAREGEENVLRFALPLRAG